MADVVLKDVTKIFGGEIVGVRNLSVEIPDKCFCVLVGPSGCGKSTTLRLIAGLEEPTSGEIYIGGRTVNRMQPKDRDVAMVFQNYALYPHMSVYNNMAFGLKLRRYPKKEIENRVMEASRILGIEELLGRKPKALSGGQRQRVAVGRAIVRKPKVFLFDEPLSNLDAKLRVQMRTELLKLHTQLNSTIIYVTHDQIEAMTMGEKIVLLKDGITQQIADPITLYNKPINKFVAGFIGSPGMNFFKAGIKSNSIIFYEGNFKLKSIKKMGTYLNREIIVGLRPEDIYCAKTFKGEKVLACVEVVEPIGDAVYVHFRKGKSSFVSRFPTSIIPDLGEEIEIVFDKKKLHFFDAKTKERI